MNRKSFGNWGEEQAKIYLEDHGFRILDQNYRCRIGEVDLIALDGEYLVFIEVKTRSSTAYGFPMEAIGTKKQNKYFNMASVYTKHKGIHEASIRFDIVEVMTRKDKALEINHVANAFQPNRGNYYR